MMRAVAILAVLPDYRENFVISLRELARESGVELTLIAGDEHLDVTVRSKNFPSVVRVANRAFFGRRLLWQSGAMLHAKGADVVVVDLNPRSLTAWVVLLRRRLRGQRTLVWGHVNPRRGADSVTAPLRRGMRRLADGVISYTWSDSDQVRGEDGSRAVWVAANGLYPTTALGVELRTKRNRLLYVGRMEVEKRPLLALEAFITAVRRGCLPDDVRLSFVGDGSQLPLIRERAGSAGIEERVDLLGHVSNFEQLRSLYAETIVSLSPGYVGLSLTQSLGFGVGMLIADDEPHAPEFELANETTARMFQARDSDSLAEAMVSATRDEDQWNRADMVRSVNRMYSSTAMAEGFMLALRGEPQEMIIS